MGGQLLLIQSHKITFHARLKAQATSQTSCSNCVRMSFVFLLIFPASHDGLRCGHQKHQEAEAGMFKQSAAMCLQFKFSNSIKQALQILNGTC